MTHTRTSRSTEFNVFLPENLIENPLLLALARFGFLAIFVATSLLIIASTPLSHRYYLEIAQVDAAFNNALMTLGWNLDEVMWNLIRFQRLVGVPIFFLAALIFYHRSRNWAPLLTASYLIMSLPVLTPGVYSLTYYGSETVGLLAAYFYIYTVISIFWLLVFPNGRFFVSSSKWLLPLVAIWNLILTYQILVALEKPTLLLLLPTLLFVLFGFGVLVHRGRTGPRHHRRQIKWIVRGVAVWASLWLVFAIALELLPLLRDVPQPLLAPAVMFTLLVYTLPTISVTVVGIAIGTSVIRANLYGIDLTVNRSLVYGTVAGLLVLVFIAAAMMLQSLFGAANRDLALVISAVGSGILYNPLRRRVQNIIDRQFFGFRFDLIQLQQAQQEAPLAPRGVLTGEMLAGYRLGEIIGRGGMAEVYVGQRGSNRAAVKVMDRVWLDSHEHEEMLRRFKLEQDTVLHFDHRHVVRVYEVGEERGIHFIAMEYINGPELRHYLKQRGHLELAEALMIFGAVASALDHVHDHNVVHRDLKPANIMLRQMPNGEAEAVLMDFGIAYSEAARSYETSTGPVGTIEYMSPEQIITTEQITQRADIYALGVLLYEMLTGARPFQGGPPHVMFAHLQEQPPDPRDLRPDIPEHVAYVILRALSKNASDRYDSAAAMADDLGVQLN